MTAPFASTGAGYDLAAIAAASEAEFLEDLPTCPKPRLRAVHRGAKGTRETQIRPHGNQVISHRHVRRVTVLCSSASHVSSKHPSLSFKAQIAPVEAKKYVQ